MSSDNKSDKVSEDISDLAEQAKIVADATGREEADVLADLLDDGIVNNSHKSAEKDLVTQLREAAELITMVQSINSEVSENSVLNGGDNSTNITVETTLEGDIVDRAIEAVQRKADKIKALIITLTPIILLLTGGGLEAFGVIDMFGSDSENDGEYEYIEYYGCTDYIADNYDEYANIDDGSCYYNNGGNGGIPPPCISSWLYDDYSYAEGQDIFISFTFYDSHYCEIEIDGHFIIEIYSNGLKTDDAFINVGHFIDMVDVTYEFTNLDAGTYNVSIELHEISCETGTCDHSDEWTIEQNPTFSIENEDCVPNLNYYDLSLGADANSLTLYVDFQDENECEETDLEMRIELFWNGESYHFMDWGTHDGLAPISDSEVNYEIQEDFMTGLNDGDWYMEWSARVVNNDNSDFEVEEQTNTATIDEIEDMDCSVEITNHYRGHVSEDEEQDAILISFTVVPSDCDDEQIEIDIELYQNGYAANYTHWLEVGGNEATEVTYTFDGVAIGDSWVPQITASLDDVQLEQVQFWGIDIEEQEPEVCEINLFWIGFATNASHAQVGYDLDCGEGANDLEGYNVSVQLLVYEIGSANNSSTQTIPYEPRLHYIQGWAEDTHFITLTNFTDSNNTHYDFYCYFTWIDEEGESQMIEYKWLNRELEP